MARLDSNRFGESTLLPLPPGIHTPPSYATSKQPANLEGRSPIFLASQVSWDLKCSLDFIFRVSHMYLWKHSYREASPDTYYVDSRTFLVQTNYKDSVILTFAAKTPPHGWHQVLLPAWAGSTLPWTRAAAASECPRVTCAHPHTSRERHL